MRSWTNSRTLVAIYAGFMLVKQHWLHINIAIMLVLSGIYIGTLLGQGI